MEIDSETTTATPVQPPAKPTTAKSKKHSVQNKRQHEWIKKCVSNFSLYANLVGNSCDDPFDEQDAIEAGEFKLIMSKSTKKRLRRQQKKKLKATDRALGPRSVQMKKLNLALAKKQTKKDIKQMIKKLSNLPLKEGESNKR